MMLQFQADEDEDDNKDERKDPDDDVNVDYLRYTSLSKIHT